MEDALTHLSQDPIMDRLIQQYPKPADIAANRDPFVELVESIISQQLSVKVAAIITERLYALLPNRALTPQHILDVDQEAIRACGISYAKIRYIRSTSDAALSGLVDFKNLYKKSDSEVVSELVQIIGVGQWTAEMLLIFCLGREDVFSVGDLGIRTAISKLYGIDREDRISMIKLATQWSPYSSLACRYLWASLNNTPIIEEKEKG